MVLVAPQKDFWRGEVEGCGYARRHQPPRERQKSVKPSIYEETSIIPSLQSTSNHEDRCRRLSCCLCRCILAGEKIQVDCWNAPRFVRCGRFSVMPRVSEISRLACCVKMRSLIVWRRSFLEIRRAMFLVAFLLLWSKALSHNEKFLVEKG